MPAGAPPACDGELLPPLMEVEGFSRSCEDFLPTPPLSPKGGLAQPLPSMCDELELMSDLLLDDEEFAESLLWDLEPAVPTQDCVWSSLLAEVDLLTQSLPASSSLMAEIESQFFQALSEPAANLGPSLQQGGEGPPSDDEASTESDEVDVVGVERWSPARPNVEAAPPATRSRTLSRIRRCTLEIQQQHNYAAPSPLPLPKRPRTGGHLHPAKTPGWGLGPGAAGEEQERRRTHNVLERQRRNELKHCLLALRDQVPELSRSSKASKVVILQKATEHISSLRGEQLRLQVERDRLQRKRHRLQHKLQQLHRTTK